MASPSEDPGRARNHIEGAARPTIAQARGTTSHASANTTASAAGQHNPAEEAGDRAQAPIPKGVLNTQGRRLIERVQPRPRSRVRREANAKRGLHHGSPTHLLSAAATAHKELWQLRERQWQEASLRRAQYQAARARMVGPFPHRDTTLLRTKKSAARAVTLERKAARKRKYDV